MYEGEAMARNKYPERTVQKILDVSYQLFSNKGYEKTTIQDIVMKLGMSKGAIYHHFKSKEEILEALSNRSFQQRHMDQLEQNSDMSGLEKIRTLMRNEFADPQKAEIDKMRCAIFQIPLAAADILYHNVHENAPEMAAMIQEANADGSASVEDPQMCAELLFTLVNLWASPFINNNGEAMFLRRVHTIAKLLDNMGLPLFDENLLSLIQAYYHKIEAVL